MEERAHKVEAVRQVYKEALQIKKVKSGIEFNWENERLHGLEAQSLVSENVKTYSET